MGIQRSADDYNKLGLDTPAANLYAIKSGAPLYVIKTDSEDELKLGSASPFGMPQLAMNAGGGLASKVQIAMLRGAENQPPLDVQPVSLEVAQYS